MSKKIYNLDLTNEGAPASFVIRTMEEIDQKLGGIKDDPHRHNYYTVIWPITATGRHIIDFKEYPIKPHHLFFVSPSQVHQIITDPNPTGFVILFTPEFLQQNSIREDFISNLKLFRESDETPPLPLNPDLEKLLSSFIEQMNAAFHSDSDMKFETIGAYLKLFLISCNGQCSIVPETNTQLAETGKSLVQRFKMLVEKHYRDWHQVKDYAEELNVTPGYLNDVITSSMNTSVKDYIQHRLVLEAKRMALFVKKSGKEIGFDLGFDDPSHFSKFFKSNTGLSLAEFKNLHSSQ